MPFPVGCRLYAATCGNYSDQMTIGKTHSTLYKPRFLTMRILSPVGPMNNWFMKSPFMNQNYNDRIFPRKCVYRKGWLENGLFMNPNCTGIRLQHVMLRHIMNFRMSRVEIVFLNLNFISFMNMVSCCDIFTLSFSCLH